MYIAGVASRKRMMDKKASESLMMSVRESKVKMKIDYDFVAKYNEKLYVEERERQRQSKNKLRRVRSRFADNDSDEDQEETNQTNDNKKIANFFGKKEEPTKCDDLDLKFDFGGSLKDNPYLTDEMKSNISDPKETDNALLANYNEAGPREIDHDDMDTTYNTVQTESNLLESEYPFDQDDKLNEYKPIKKIESHSTFVEKQQNKNSNENKNVSTNLSKSQEISKNYVQINLFANQNQNCVKGSSDEESSGSDAESYETSSGSNSSDSESSSDSEESPEKEINQKVYKKPKIDLKPSEKIMQNSKNIESSKIELLPVEEKIQTDMIELAEFDEYSEKNKSSSRRNIIEEFSEKQKPKLYEKNNEKKKEKDIYNLLGSNEDETSRLNLVETENSIYMVTNEENTEVDLLNNKRDRTESSDLDFHFDPNQSSSELL